MGVHVNVVLEGVCVCVAVSRCSVMKHSSNLRLSGLDLSPSGWSALEVTQRRLVLCTLLQCAPLVRCVLSPRASLVLIRVSNAVDTT